MPFTTPSLNFNCHINLPETFVILHHNLEMSGFYVGDVCEIHRVLGIWGADTPITLNRSLG